MAKDYTKYTVEGLGENLNKRKLVLTIIKDWTEKNKPSFEDLRAIFPDELQGSKGVVKRESEVDDPKRFDMKNPLKIKNGMHVVVSNQWGENIPSFIYVAEKLGYVVTKLDLKKNLVQTLIDTTEFVPFALARQFLSYKNNDNVLEAIDIEMEELLDKDPKYYGFALIFEKMNVNQDNDDYIENFGFDYYREEIQAFFTFSNDANTLYPLLQEQTLISRILEKHSIKLEDVIDENTDFKLLFTSYFYEAINTLVNLDDEELIAEFIFSQSCSSEGIDSDDGDWLADFTIDILLYVYNKYIGSEKYENGCALHANHFGYAVDCGYDYLAFSREIIDDTI